MRNQTNSTSDLVMYSISVILGILLALGVAAVFAWIIVFFVQTLPSPITPLKTRAVDQHTVGMRGSKTNRESGQSDRNDSPAGESNLPGVRIVPLSEVEEVNAPPRASAFSAAHSLPAEVELEKVAIGKQTRSLNCEFQSASDLAWYYGLPYDWDDLYKIVGHDPGGDPHKGFVGASFDDAPGQLYPNGYGVYAEPIAKALTQIGLPAEVHYSEPVVWLKEELSAGKPIMVWTTANMVTYPVEIWYTQDKKQIKGVRYEHTYLLIGYDAQTVLLADPWDGQKHRFPWDAFISSWSLFDRMSVVASETPAPD